MLLHRAWHEEDLEFDQARAPAIAVSSQVIFSASWPQNVDRMSQIASPITSWKNLLLHGKRTRKIKLASEHCAKHRDSHLKECAPLQCSIDVFGDIKLRRCTLPDLVRRGTNLVPGSCPDASDWMYDLACWCTPKQHLQEARDRCVPLPDQSFDPFMPHRNQHLCTTFNEAFSTSQRPRIDYLASRALIILMFGTVVLAAACCS